MSARPTPRLLPVIFSFPAVGAAVAILPSILLALAALGEALNTVFTSVSAELDGSAPPLDDSSGSMLMALAAVSAIFFPSPFLFIMALKLWPGLAVRMDGVLAPAPPGGGGPTPTAVLLGLSLGLSCATAVAVLLPAAVTAVSIGMIVLGAPALFAGLFDHFRPNIDRGRKYARVLVGLVLVSASYFALIDPEGQGAVVFGLNAALCALSAAGSLAIGVLASRSAPGRALDKAYGLVRGGGAWSFLGLQLLVPVFPLAWYVLRYWAGEASARRPIVFLRSFDHAGASAAYGRIVGPSTARVAPVHALVHRRQGAIELCGESSMFLHPRSFVVPDIAWVQWVSERLTSCRGAVLDMSEGTPGVSWELDEAVRIVGADRVAVLVEEGRAASIPPSVTTITYRFDPASERAAREQLYRWARSLPPQ